MKAKKNLFTIFLFVLCAFSTHAQYDSIQHASGYRTYLLHVPPSYVPGTPMPLIIAMHGGFGWGAQLQNQSKLSVKSNIAGFIVVYPEGVKGQFGIRTWNAGGCCGYAMTNNIDDVGFIMALLDTLIANYSIDTTRVYATGISNGAFMSYRLACEKSDRIAAIAPVAGSMNVSACNPVRPVPIIHFHSYLDTAVPYQGGIGTGTSGHYNPPLDSVFNAWSSYDNCTVQHDTIHDSTDYTQVNWTNCNCNTAINFYITHDGGHSWPGGTATETGDSVSTVVNANDLMWTFFQQHSLACSSIGISEMTTESQFKVFPNPFSDITKIQSESAFHDATLTIFNPVGRVVMKMENISGHTITINRENLPAGIYYILLSQAYNSNTAKLIITD